MSTLTREEIFYKIKQILLEQFEIDTDLITPEANLYQDLDIDSIDAVNLIIELKSITQRKMALEEFNEVKTIADVVSAVERALQEHNEQP
jgi:acyl carrier protein